MKANLPSDSEPESSQNYVKAIPSIALDARHIPVMMSEVLEIIDPKAEFSYIDGTLGLAGHSQLILSKISGPAQLIGFDRDSESLKIARANLDSFINNSNSASQYSIDLLNKRFSEIADLKEAELKFPVKAILLDLGISSHQLDTASYGLNFSAEAKQEKLDMRLDQWCKSDAAEILNKWPEKKIADMFWDNADYVAARRLAKAVVQARPLNTMGEFIELCFQCRPGGGGAAKGVSRMHPATLPLMALRIAVNEELEELSKGLEKIINWMEPGCKLLVISFHSGEDRIVKNIFKQYKSSLEIFHPKPLCPSLQEVQINPRARSAKLRAVAKIKQT